MVRKFKKDDIEILMDLWLKGNTEAHSFIDLDYWKRNFSMVKDMMYSAEIYVFECCGEIRGFMGLTENYIAGIFVDSKYRSQGIGKKLIDYAKSIKEELVLSVYSKNKGALSFYVREGFKITEECIDHNTGEKECQMKWRKFEIKKVDENRKKYIDLLLLADEQESMIDKYIDKGDMFVLNVNAFAVAECIVVNNGKGEYEIKNIAVVPEKQGKGYGKKLVEFVFSYYNDCEIMYVGTGDSDLTIPFYESCGFEESHRVKNFFTDNYDKPIFESGKQLIDMVYLMRKKEL